MLFAYALSLLGILMLWALQWAPNFWLLTGFVVCFGSTIGSRGPLLAATAMKIFRGKQLGTIYGTITFGSSVSGTIELSSVLPDITAPLTISGPGARP